MKQINIKFSSKESYYEALQEHGVDLSSNQILIQLFSSVNEKETLENIAKSILNVTPNATLIGATTAGEIFEGSMYENSTILSISIFKSTTIVGTHVIDEDSHRLGKKLFNLLDNQDSKCIITFADGLQHNGEHILAGMNENNSNLIPIAGGMAADLVKFEKTFTIYNKMVFSGGAVGVALLGDDLEVHQDYNLGWRSIGPKFTITKSSNNTVYEINDKPIVELYEEVLGKEVVQKLPSSTIEFPLIKKNNEGFVARSMIALNDDNSIVFAGNLHEGDEVQFGVGSTSLVNSYNPNEEVQSSDIQAIFIYSCSARKQFLGKNLESNFKYLHSIAPTSGFFTYGEFYGKNAQNNFLNITSTFLYLNEKYTDTHERIVVKERKEPQTLTSNALFHLIDYAKKKSEVYEKELHNKNNLLEDYLEKIDSVLIVSKTDPQGKITYVNQKFVDISGYSAEELIGKPHNIVRHPENSASFFQDLWSTIQNKKVWSGSFANLAKDGSTYYVKTSIIPILDKDDSVTEYIAIREDVTELVNTTKKLKAQEEYTNMIFESKDSMVAVLKNNKLTALNDKFFEDFAYKDFDSFISWHECICELFIKTDGYLSATTADKLWFEDVLLYPSKTHKAKMLNKYNQERVYSVKAKQKTLNDEVYGIANFYDITELEDSKLEALNALEIKGKFLANMSHEIRTPMNGILGFVDLLMETKLDQQQSKYIDTIKTSTNTLLTIINDILDFSKIDSNKLDIELIPSNLKKLSINVHSLLTPIAEKKSISYILSVDEDIDTCLVFDPTRLSQVLSNLTSNAIKFTPKNGSVEFKLDVLKTTSTSQSIKIVVRDSGIGIAKENQEKIFKAFSQENSSTTREFGGTGLGLSISSSLVKSMDSELKVSSTLGEGSTFFFTLTLQRCSNAEILEAKSEDIKKNLQPIRDGLKVLVAEDNEINRMLMENIFKNKNVELSFATNGREAVENVKNNVFDIIFMDINMPIMNGIDATKIIRDELHSRVPIIALTANAIQGDKERFIAEGMNDYMSKPIIMNDLDRILQQWAPLLENQEIQDEDYQFNLEKTISTMNEMLSLSEAITIKMLNSVAGSIDVTLKELEQAIVNQDYEVIANIAHKLKGSSCSLYLEPICELFKKMEEDALKEEQSEYLQSYDKIRKYYQTLKTTMKNRT